MTQAPAARRTVAGTRPASPGAREWPRAWPPYDYADLPAGRDLARCAVAARGLTKVFPGSRKRAPTTAVNGLDLTVEAGAISGLLGPNGSGKTTTIDMLTGLHLPTSGEVTIFGRSPRDRAARWLIGVISQENASYRQLTARQNLMTHAMIYGYAGGEARRRTDRALDLADLRDRADDPVKDFSGGMKRRLQIAQHILHGPKVLFMDEPTLGVDPTQRTALEKTIRELAGSGVAVFLTTNVLDEAARLCRQVAIINHGRLVAEGAPAQLQRRYGHVDITVRVTATREACKAALDKAVTIQGVRAARGHGIPLGKAELVITTDTGEGTTGRVLAALAGNDELGIIDVETSLPALDEVFDQLTGPNRILR